LLRVFGQVLEITLFPLGKRLTVGEEKLQIARMRRNDMRKMHPVDDAGAERERKAGVGMIGVSISCVALEAQSGSIAGAPQAMEFVSIV
jgi:hypothetical protein